MLELSSRWRRSVTSVLMASGPKHCCHILFYSVSIFCFVYVSQVVQERGRKSIWAKKGEYKKMKKDKSIIVICESSLKKFCEFSECSDLGFSVTSELIKARNLNINLLSIR